MSRRSDDFPTVGRYRGIPLHDYQSHERIEEIVCPEIDHVLKLTRPRELLAFAADCRHAPESRLLAAQRIRDLTRAAGPRQSVGVSMNSIDAATAGLDSLRYADPWSYATLMDCPLASAAPRPPEQAARLRAEQDRREPPEETN